MVEDAVVPIGVAVGSYWLGRYDRERARSQHLQLITTRWQPHGLRLEVRYRPASAHATIVAQMSTAQAGVRLFGGRPVVNPAPLVSGGHIRFEFDGQFMGNGGQITLRSYDGTDTLMGVMFLMPDGEQEWLLRKTPVALTIAEASGKKLVKRKLVISPIDESANAAYMMPAPLNQISFQ